MRSQSLRLAIARMGTGFGVAVLTCSLYLTLLDQHLRKANNIAMHAEA